MIWPMPTQQQRGCWRVGARLDAGLRVLIVEDDAAIAHMYRHQLERDGMSVAVVADGHSGVSAIQSGSWDVVLLDIRLPRLDGFGVLKALNTGAAAALPAPVVILSNYSDLSMIRQGLELGASDYLVKSATTPSQLSAKVRAVAGAPGPEGQA